MIKQSQKEQHILNSINNAKYTFKERYFISKNINTSYNDIGKITPIEREYLIEFIVDEQKQTKKRLDEIKQQRNSR